MNFFPRIRCLDTFVQFARILDQVISRGCSVTANIMLRKLKFCKCFFSLLSGTTNFISIQNDGLDSTVTSYVAYELESIRKMPSILPRPPSHETLQFVDSRQHGFTDIGASSLKHKGFRCHVGPSISTRRSSTFAPVCGTTHIFE